MLRTDRTAATVVFDARCVLCSVWTRFLIQRDHARLLRFAPMQGETGRRLLHAHGINADDPSTFLLVFGDQADGRAHSASDGVIRILEFLGGGWRLAAAARVIPKPFRDWLYRLIARNRYAWFGRRAECFVPDGSERQRFLF